MSLYVAYLSRTLKYSSIQNYVSAVKFLHGFLGYDYPWDNSFIIKATLKGYKRLLGDKVARKAPITFDMLCDIVNECDPQTESGFIACIVVGFYTFLRKSNLCPKSVNTFDPQFSLSRQSFALTDYGAIVKVHGSKVIQFKDRVLELPLVRNHQFPNVCPVTAILRHFDLVHRPGDSPAFCHANGKAIVHKELCSFLKQKVERCGYDSSEISGHSLRRGGASHAYQNGAPIEMVSLMGDWASLAVLCYLTRPLNQRIEVAKLMCKN